jgi:Holliday junction resolvase RusA-like endonuclease
MYTPKATREAERRIAAEWVRSGGPKFDGPCELYVVFDGLETNITVTENSAAQLSKMRNDLDNLIKLVGDALNGVAFEDDRQIVKIVGLKL